MRTKDDVRYESKDIVIPILGMTCAGCVKKIENALSRIEGVEKVSVNLLSEKASLRVKDLKEEVIHKIVETVTDHGYEVPVQKAVFLVRNLSMISSKTLVEKAIKRIPGVISVSLSHVTDQIEIEFLPTIFSLEDVKRRLEGLGLDVFEVGEEEAGSYEEIRRTREEKDLTRRFFVSAIFSALILVDMFSHFIYHGHSRHFVNLILFLFTTPVFFYGGAKFHKAFFRSVPRLSFDMNSLISVGSGSAYFFSSLNTFLPYFVKSYQFTDVYYETSAIIITLVLLGRILESKAKKKAYEALKNLASLLPKKARVLRNGKDLEVLTKEIEEGDIVIIKPGERIPADGIIVDGYGTLDESSITGEATPKVKKVGDFLFASTLNQAGSFKLRVTSSGKDTLLFRIIAIIKEVEAHKPPIQILADKVASVFVPIIFGIATVAFLSWYLFGHPLSFSLMIFVSTLIVACPCALGLATPIAIFVAGTNAAKEGLLIKNGAALEVARKINYFVFDKTGTLTYGVPEVKNVYAFEPITKKELLLLSASLERNSEHPLAKAIFEYAKKEGLELLEPKNFHYVPGQGVIGNVDSKMVAIGTLSFIKSMGIEGLDQLENAYSELTKEGNTVVVVAIEGKASGFIAIGDKLREDAAQVIENLKRKEIKVALLTGDSKEVAKSLAKKIGIDEVFAEVLPDQKSERIQDLKKKGYLVAMIGDGINDAPALATADIGFAMGKGTDIAAKTADVILINDDLKAIPKFIKLSSATHTVIKQNLFWAFFYNFSLIPVAAGTLYPFFGILLKPIYASIAMTISSLFVVMNSLRLKKLNLDREGDR